MKKSRKVHYIFCLAIILPLCVALLGSVFAASVAGRSIGADAKVDSNVVTTVQDEGVVRPEDIDEGLSVKSLADIQGRRVTVRQPVMEVTNYNVERPKEVKLLEDTYYLGDFKTREVMDELAKVTFTGEVGNAKSSDPRYPMKGLQNSPKNGEEGGQKYFSCFEKYMLLRQAYYFNTHAMDIVKEGHLVKHPAADYIYGKIDEDADAVTMHIITDPIYRSPMTTGLYLAPGEVATVTVSGLKKGEKLVLYTHHQDTMGYKGYNDEGKDVFSTTEKYFEYWDRKILDIAEAARNSGQPPKFTDLNYGLHGQWVWQNQKVPCMGTTFTIVGDGNEKMEVPIGSMYGGPLYFKPTDSSVDMTITGAVLTPHFVLGVTTVQDFEDHYRDAPGLVATLDCENGQLIGPAVDMKNADDIEKLAYFWHSVFAIDISLNGREYNYNMTMCYDMHVPAGEAVALNSNFCAQPSYWFDTCMNYEELTTHGNWGTFHELGHVQAKTYGVNWGFADGDGEVWNNTLILLIYSLLCNMDNRLAYVEHGEYVHPYTAVVRSQSINDTYEKDGEQHKITDYGQINEGKGAHFDQLSMYATLLHSFGPEKFVDMFYTYKLNPKYCENKRADFVYRIALVDRVNILDWVNTNYFASIPNNAFNESQFEFIKSLPDFYPVAYRWANGIDGNETARKYEVDGKHDTVFDLSGENISSPKTVNIVKVTQPRYGKTEYNKETKKVTYKPPQKATEYDEFEIIVEVCGRQVTLNVRFKLLYRGTYTQVWNLGTSKDNPFKKDKPTLNEVREHIKDKEPTSIEVNSCAGKNDFDHPAMEYFHMSFQFMATKSGTHTFYLRADDISEVKFYKNGDSNGTLVGTMKTTKDQQSFSDTDGTRRVEIQLAANEKLYVEAELLNWGGKGHLHIGLKMPGDESSDIKDIPVENIINSEATEQDLAAEKTFEGWQPRFVDSIKDVTMDYVEEKAKWKVLEAPISEGDLDVAKAALIDDDAATQYHSSYQRQKPELPHVFVIDTGENHKFNFFEALRRTNNNNDRLLEYELYGMKDTGITYDEKTMGGQNYKGWTQLFSGKASNETAAKQRMTFDEQEIRWFKFVVKKNNGNTVIKEFYAGMQTELNQPVRPNAYDTGKYDDFEENLANGKLKARTLGAVYEFSFLGSGFELYSDTDPSFGSAKITVDDVYKDTISLAEKRIFNKCVYQSGKLELKTHTVKVETTTNEPFNISFINVIYGTPVDKDDYPALTKEDGTEDFGDTEIDRVFTREWRTYVSDYKTLTSIRFLKDIPTDYEDTYRRIDDYIRIYRKTGDSSKVAFVYAGKILAPTECGSLFAGCEKLSELDFTNFDTSSVRGATSMFNGCATMTNFELEKFSADNLQSMGQMFANCVSVGKLDLSGFKLTGNVNIANMFEHCVNLTEIKLPKNIGEKAESKLPGIYFDKDNNEYVLTVTAKNAGHTLTLHNKHEFDKSVIVAKKNPTCTEEGERPYHKCDVCGFRFDPEAENELLTESNDKIPPTGHDLEYEYGKWPTCTESGDGYKQKCTVCGAVLLEGEAAPPTGHMYILDTSEGEGKGYVFESDAEGNATLTIYFVCMLYDYNAPTIPPCGSKAEVVVHIDSASYKEATCTENASYSYDRVVTGEEVDAILNKDKAIPDEIYKFQNIAIYETVEVAHSLGHQYNKPTFNWNGTESATATFTCSRPSCPDEGGHTVTVEATVTCVGEMEATCLEAACTRYKATAGVEDGVEYSDIKSIYKDENKKDHDFSGAYSLFEGNKHQRLCRNGCEQYGATELCKEQDSWWQSDDGTMHYKMCVCGRHMNESEHNFVVVTDWPSSADGALAHNAATLKCADCGKVVTDDLTVEVTRDETACESPTCERAGVEAFTLTVTYNENTYSISKTYDISCLGHIYVPISGNALEWASDGHYNNAILHLVCSRCSDEEGHTKDIMITSKQQGDGAYTCGSHADSITYIVDLGDEETLATVMLEIGGNNTIDRAEFKKVTSLSQTVNGELICHVWTIQGEPQFKVSGDKRSATLEVTLKCSRCEKTFVLSFDCDYAHTEATCEKAEEIVFSLPAKSVDEMELYANNSKPQGVTLFTDDIFPALAMQTHFEEGEGKRDHNWENVEETPATCTQDGNEAGRRCLDCGYTEGMETIAAHGHTEKIVPAIAATCTTSGATEGRICSVCGETLVQQTVIAALGHDENIHDDGIDATCTEAGMSATISCNRCGITLHERRTIAKLGHTEVVGNDGKAATCTEDGWTATVSCSVCGETLRGREVIHALGHDEKHHGDGKDATCTEDGRTSTVSCIRCGEILHSGESIPATGHKWEIVPGTPATETKPGLSDGEVCSECGEVRKAQTEIPPLGKKGGLSTGALVGILGGGVAVIACVGVVVFIMVKKRRRL